MPILRFQQDHWTNANQERKRQKKHLQSNDIYCNHVRTSKWKGRKKKQKWNDRTYYAFSDFVLLHSILLPRFNFFFWPLIFLSIECIPKRTNNEKTFFVSTWKHTNNIPIKWMLNAYSARTEVLWVISERTKTHTLTWMWRLLKTRKMHLKMGKKIKCHTSFFALHYFSCYYSWCHSFFVVYSSIPVLGSPVDFNFHIIICVRFTVC